MKNPAIPGINISKYEILKSQYERRTPSASMPKMHISENTVLNIPVALP